MLILVEPSMPAQEAIVKALKVTVTVALGLHMPSHRLKATVKALKGRFVKPGGTLSRPRSLKQL
ncbi:hypothetical protein [Thermofilum pendens]